MTTTHVLARRAAYASALLLFGGLVVAGAFHQLYPDSQTVSSWGMGIALGGAFLTAAFVVLANRTRPKRQIIVVREEDAARAILPRPGAEGLRQAMLAGRDPRTLATIGWKEVDRPKDWYAIEPRR